MDLATDLVSFRVWWTGGSGVGSEERGDERGRG